jgi:site-specific DNA-methyltransferase (adenine-specific)
MTEGASGISLMLGDCLERLKELPDNSVDSVVTDPPYGLSFMGKKWDYDVPSVEVWEECFRVLKPGGHLLAFAGTRTQHRMAVRIEDAGFEIRDMIAWVYGSGFPKSLDVSKAIDRAAGAEREVVGVKTEPNGRNRLDEPHGVVARNTWGDVNSGFRESVEKRLLTAPATDAARQWQGWGTALKPALEPITVARKPLGEKTVVANVLKHGTGAINVDGCRVGAETLPAQSRGVSKIGTFEGADGNITPERDGRWPANLIHDGSDDVVGLFPVTTSGKPCGKRGASNHNVAYADVAVGSDLTGYGDTGSASRFFYCAKASKKDRDEGCEELPLQSSYMVENGSKTAAAANGVRYDRTTQQRNNHPTVKPTNLMRYLCRLVTPPEGIVLDPFMGSGSTGKAAILESFQFVGIERDEEYIKIAESRIQAAVLSKSETLEYA